MIPIPPGKIGAAIVQKYFPVEEWEQAYDNNGVAELKAIKEFTGFDFDRIKSLSYCEYLLYRRESWLFGLKQSEEGRKFLKALYRLKQTEADTPAVHRFQERGQ